MLVEPGAGIVEEPDEAVGWIGVYVGIIGVLVGGTEVWVGGTGVMLGGIGIWVDGTGVKVGSTGAAPGADKDLQLASSTTKTVIKIMRLSISVSNF
jgi:hypothetical protein